MGSWRVSGGGRALSGFLMTAACCDCCSMARPRPNALIFHFLPASLQRDSSMRPNGKNSHSYVPVVVDLELELVGVPLKRGDAVLGGVQREVLHVAAPGAPVGCAKKGVR